MAELVTPAAFHQILEALRLTHDLVVVDCWTTLNEATFDQCDVPGQPGLRVKIVAAFASRAGNTTVEIRNVTPPVDNLPKDDSARWRAAGMTPDGRPLDPKQLH